MNTNRFTILLDASPRSERDAARRSGGRRHALTRQGWTVLLLVIALVCGAVSPDLAMSAPATDVAGTVPSIVAGPNDTSANDDSLGADCGQLRVKVGLSAPGKPHPPVRRVHEAGRQDQVSSDVTPPAGLKIAGVQAGPTTTSRAETNSAGPTLYSLGTCLLL